MRLLFSHKHTHVLLPPMEGMTKCRSQSQLSSFKPGSSPSQFVCGTQAQPFGAGSVLLPGARCTSCFLSSASSSQNYRPRSLLRWILLYSYSFHLQINTCIFYLYFVWPLFLTLFGAFIIILVFWLSLISLPKSYCSHVISTPSSPSYTPMP